MDAWWPRFVRAQFQPALGKELFDTVEDRVLGLGGFGWDWATHVQKDLRNVLGRRVRGRYSRVYCGGPAPGRVKTAQAAGGCGGAAARCCSTLAAGRP